MSQDIVCQKLRVMFSGTNLNYFLNLEKEKAEPGRSIIPRFIEINKFQQYRSLSLLHPYGALTSWKKLEKFDSYWLRD